MAAPAVLIELRLGLCACAVLMCAVLCAERLQRLITQMKWRLKEGQGEAVYEVRCVMCDAAWLWFTPVSAW